MTLNKILESLEEASKSKREKGSKFEILIKNWFLTTKLYTDKTGNYINTIKEYRNYKELKEEEQRKKYDNDNDFILGAAIGATTSAVILNSIK